jgi:hypothetical protein
MCNFNSSLYSFGVKTNHGQTADICGPLPSGDYLVAITDEYSRYPIVEIIKSESATTVIPVLDKVISTLLFLGDPHVQFQ